MIKDLLVNVSIGAKNDAATPYAVALAEAFGAHATAVAFAFEPLIGVSLWDSVPSEFIEAQRAESEQAANKARARFEEAARRAGITANSHVFSGSLAGAADQFGQMGRCFDLSVVMQAEANAAAEELIIEAALFQSGRPVIVVPYIHRDGLKTDRIMVCWDGGRMAARAVADAMPLLARAERVDVVMVTGEIGKRDEIPGADIGEHLARYGLNVEVKRLVANDSAQNMLLSYAADNGIDMMVMGGYGHSRLRQFILGGVTRGMLGAMTVPCFMSH